MKVIPTKHYFVRTTMLLIAIANLLYLSACVGEPSMEQLARDIRDEYSRAANITASMEVVANYGERNYQYSMDFLWQEGTTSLTVTAPEEMAGVIATIDEDGTTMEFDGAVIPTDDHAVATSPINAASLFLDIIMNGEISSTSKVTLNGTEALKICYNILKDDTDIDVTIWFDLDNHAILQGNVLDGESQTQCTFNNFSFSNEMTDSPSAEVPTSTISPKGIKTNEDRVAYLESYGWQVQADPVVVEELLIPAEFDDTYGQYLQLQADQGFDLTKYQSKRVKRYAYLITNYPTGEDGIQAELLIYKNTVVGGEVLSSDPEGFIHGLAMPDSNEDPLQKATADEKASQPKRDEVNTSSQPKRDEANTSIQTMASLTKKEAQIEALVIAKGYTDCVVFIGDNSVSVVVGNEGNGLTDTDVAKISEIVTDKTGMPASQVKIIEASP